QAGHGDTVTLVNDLLGGWRLAGADLGDHAVARQDPAVFDLVARAGVDEPSPDQQGRQSVRSCGRTGTRVISRPVAARIAATMAGPEEIVGGSPTPFTPYRGLGAPSATKFIPTGGMSGAVGRREAVYDAVRMTPALT